MNSNFSIEDKYVIGQQILEQGTHSKVLKGIDKTQNQLIACKIVPIKVLETNSIKKYIFSKDVEQQQKMKSSHILKLFNIYKDKENYYLIQEYCNNGDLDSFIKNNGPLNEKQAMELLLQILEGLRELHSKSIVIRDLMSTNIYIHNKKLKIADFGSKRMIDYQQIEQIEKNKSYFLAPEVIEKQKYGIEADTFSLGVILYFMLFNEYPFKGNSSYDIYQNIKLQRVDYQRNGNQIQYSMTELLQSLLKFDRKQRITWKKIYEHPTLTKYINQPIDLSMYENPINDITQQFNYFNEQLPIAVEIQPIKINSEEIEYFISNQELKKQFIQDNVDGLKKYYHQKNIYDYLTNVVKTFPYLQKLNINYDILAYLIQKKILNLNQNLLKDIKAKTNIFKMKYFDFFVNSEHYKDIEEIVSEDQKQIKISFNQTQMAAKKIYINDLNLAFEINNEEILILNDDNMLNNYQRFLKGYIIDYAAYLTVQLNENDNLQEQKFLFQSIIQIYKSYDIETYPFDYDFEKENNDLLKKETKQEYADQIGLAYELIQF